MSGLVAGALALLVLAGAAPGATTGTGSISGIIMPPSRCTRVEALLRAGRDPRKPQVFVGEYDGKTGAFRIANLPDGTYDLRLTVPGGTIEGADLRPDKPSRDDREFSDEDRKEILEKIENYPESYLDIHRPLYLVGNGYHAKALVEGIRYREFHSGKPGEQVWRVEIWLYDYHYGGWVKRQHGWTVLARVRTNVDMAPEAFRDLMRLFDPKLGGIDVRDGAAVADVRYEIPEHLDMRMGKTPGSIETQAAEHRKKKEKEIVY